MIGGETREYLGAERENGLESVPNAPECVTAAQEGAERRDTSPECGGEDRAVVSRGGWVETGTVGAAAVRAGAGAVTEARAAAGAVACMGGFGGPGQRWREAVRVAGADNSVVAAGRAGAGAGVGAGPAV